MKREIHDLLQNLVNDSEISEEPKVSVSEASRQKVDEIVEKMNQEKPAESSAPKPVYDKPPKRKRPPVVQPEPVSHFSEEPSQNPVVRMHDRLLQDAMPQPGKGKKTVQKKNKHKKTKKTKQAAENRQPKKKFHIEIKEELPPDIPRDTSVADRLKQERLEEVLASAPPRTPEEIRQEKIKKRAAEIRKQMQLRAEQQPETPDTVSEPEEEIPAWEEKLSEFSQMGETERSAQLEVFKEAEQQEMPVFSELPDIPEISEEDTGLLSISEELRDIIPDEPEQSVPSPKKKKSGKKTDKAKNKKKSGTKTEKKTGLFRKMTAFLEKENSHDTEHLNKKSNPVKTGKGKKQKEETAEPVFYHQPEKVAEVLLEPESAENKQTPDMDFVPTAMLETVSMPAVKPKMKKKVTVYKRNRKIS